MRKKLSPKKSKVADLRIKDPSLPKLRFISSEGIADDKTFIKTILEGNLILSNDCEFLHDQYVHIISHISMIASTSDPENTYEFVMMQFKIEVEGIISEIEKIENNIGPAEQKKTRVPSELLWARLGAVVDTTLSYSNLKHMSDFIFTWGQMGNKGLWQFYLEKRFGDKYTENKEELDTVWEDIVEEARFQRMKLVSQWLENSKKSEV